MKITISTTGGKDFIKPAKELSHKTVLTILDNGQFIEQENYAKTAIEKVLYFNVKLEAGKEGLLKFNKMTQSCLVEAFGDDTDDWKNKKVKAWKTKNPTGGDDFYILTAIDWQRNDMGEWDKPFNLQKAEDALLDAQSEGSEPF